MTDLASVNQQSVTSSSMKERGNKKDLQVIRTSFSQPPDQGVCCRLLILQPVDLKIVMCLQCCNDSV